MGSTLTWLDYSEHERRKMLDVIELFGEKTTRDELGLGSVRDALADLMFPGTSTIQTAAKYFLFVPWTYLTLEQRRTPSPKVAQRARKLEIALAKQLIESSKSGGVIGRLAGEKLQRLPSSVYWQGLYRWGIRVFPGSQDEYHRSLDLFYQRQRAWKASTHDFEGEAANEAEPHNWHAGLPAPSEDFPQGATLKLEPHEAEYLRERIITSCPNSLIAYLVRDYVQVDGAEFVWQQSADLPEHLRKQVNHGWNYSLSMHGAQLLYNLILAEMTQREAETDLYRGRLRDWWQRVEERREALLAWDRTEFWRIAYRENPRIARRAHGFISTWIDLVLAANDESTITDGSAARRLVEHRELQLKHGLARVRSARARELWAGAAGAAQMDLRWPNAQRIVLDVLEGLRVSTGA